MGKGGKEGEDEDEEDGGDEKEEEEEEEKMMVFDEPTHVNPLMSTPWRCTRAHSMEKLADRWLSRTSLARSSKL
eukprot:9467944-Pyramimonas_sp.AAC.1